MKRYRRRYWLITEIKRTQAHDDPKPTYTTTGIPCDHARVSGGLHRATKNLGDCMVCHKPIMKGQLYVQPHSLWANRVHASCHHYPCYLAVRVKSRTLLRGATVYVKEFKEAPKDEEDQKEASVSQGQV